MIRIKVYWGVFSLLQTLVADLCVEYCSLQGACRGGVCRRTPPSVTNLCREMAAQACYQANVVDSLPYMYIYLSIHPSSHLCVQANSIPAAPPSVKASWSLLYLGFLNGNCEVLVMLFFSQQGFGGAVPVHPTAAIPTRACGH